jgi:hypothetical protein
MIGGLDWTLVDIVAKRDVLLDAYKQIPGMGHRAGLAISQRDTGPPIVESP